MTMIHEIESLYPQIVDIRRDIHQHPEIGFDVHRTAALVADFLTELGLKVQTGIGKTGVIADLDVPGTTGRVALRADMDALPIEEQSEQPYRSQVVGAAHLCGHDAHTAMLLGTAALLTRHRERLPVSVRFIFQPNEENLPGGAPAMIRDGALNGVDRIFGQHVWPLLPAGAAGICEGPVMAQPDVFEIEIVGAGGHAAAPHKTIDPIVIGAQFIANLQSAVARQVDPRETAVVSVTQFHAGTTHNVIPERAFITGTVRTFKRQIQQQIRRRIEQEIQALCAVYGADHRISYQEGYPVTVNDPAAAQTARTAAERALGKANVIFPAEPFPGGEDFAYFAREVPGCFIFLGCRNEKTGRVHMLHHPRFDIDEEIMKHGMNILSEIVLNYTDETEG